MTIKPSLVASIIAVAVAPALDLACRFGEHGHGGVK